MKVIKVCKHIGMNARELRLVKKHCVKLLLDYGGNKDANGVKNVKLDSGIYVKVCNNGSLFKINFS